MINTKETMIFPFFLLGLSLINFMNSQRTTLPAKMTLPADLNKWCPYTTFCQSENENQSNRTTPNQQVGRSDGFKPCCEPCSCDADCGLKRQCCRSEFDRSAIDTILGTVCKSLTTNGKSSREDECYNVVDKCPESFREIEPCSALNVSSWGSYLPVYARSTGMIYHNHLCAACHNIEQSDVVHFTPVVSFEFSTSLNWKALSDGFNGQTDGAFMYFLVPNTIDVSSERCYPYMIRDCDDVEKGTGASNLGELCTNFNATFHAGSLTYQNVYCYLCRRDDVVPNQEWMEFYSMCPSKDSMKSLPNLPLSILLDDEPAEAESTGEKDDEKYVCFGSGNHNGEQECRPLNCPEGQYRLGGSCRYYGKQWYVRHLRVWIKLTPVNEHETLLVSQLLGIPQAKLSSKSKEDLVRRPALLNWNLDLFYNANDNHNALVSNLVTVLSKGADFVHPSELFDEIQAALRGEWFVDVNGKTYAFRATFNEHITYFSNWKRSGRDPLNEFVPYWESPESEGDVDLFTTDKIRVLSPELDLALFRPGDALCITKLYFCKQIDLLPEEYMISSVAKHGPVLLASRQIVLGNGEFTTINPKNGANGIRACASDVIDGSASVNTDNLRAALVLGVNLVLIASNCAM